MVRGQTRRTEATATPEAAAPDAAARIVTTYRVGKLTTKTGPILCLVRGLSEKIARLDIDMPFAGDDQATLEIGGERLTGTLVKLGDRQAELHSAATIDVETLLADPSILASLGQRTLPRVDVDARARIDFGGQRVPAQVRDISTDGIKVYTEELLASGDAVRIILKGFDTPLAGLVRWTDGDYAGIEFAQRLPIGRINAWLAAQAATDTGFDAAPWASGVVSRS